VPLAPQDALAELPLRSRTPLAWAQSVLQDPLSLLIDHAVLEKKAANNAMDMLTRWPGDFVPGWVETMTSVARDEAAHLSQVVRILGRRGGRLNRSHQNAYAKELRLLVRAGQPHEAIDRLFVSSLIEARSCERFAVLAEAAAEPDPELAAFYTALFSSELGHFKIFLKLAYKLGERAELEARWDEMLAHEARIITAQKPGPRIHSGLPAI
jgi:tRNA-(ms[2]io[6]A)-hydroxylase